jgi:hypothetical protein
VLPEVVVGGGDPSSYDDTARNASTDIRGCFRFNSIDARIVGSQYPFSKLLRGEDRLTSAAS